MISKYEILIMILCNYFGVKEYQLDILFKEKENLYILILLLNKYNCLNVDYLMKIKLDVSTSKKLQSKLKKAEEKVLINIDFRKKYFKLEEIVEKNLRNA